ncbi:MAG: hypothetical protein Kow0063_24340 [Anaerolineae bacterium]
MLFVQTFDPRPGVSAQQVKELYFRVASQWLEIWPSNKFVGLFEHKFVGSGPRFMAIWEMPGFAAFDEWHSEWPGVKERGFVALENQLWDCITNNATRVMERCEPSQNGPES